MKRLAIALSAVIALHAQTSKAELVYTGEEMRIVLLDDKCPSEPQIHIAYAENLAGTERADGCWYKGKTDTYVVLIHAGGTNIYQYDIYRSKFEFRGAR